MVCLFPVAYSRHGNKEPSLVDRFSRIFHHTHIVDTERSVAVLPVQANALPVSHQHWNEPACCSLQPLRHSQRTTPPFLCVVFLATGGTNPAHSLRILLLRAGIEPNPGPPRKSDSTPPCETCGDTIRKGVSRFRCAAPGCDKACHLQPVCSYISRATAMKKKWHCTEHRSPSSPDRPSLPGQYKLDAQLLPHPTSYAQFAY